MFSDLLRMIFKNEQHKIVESKNLIGISFTEDKMIIVYITLDNEKLVLKNLESYKITGMDSIADCLTDFVNKYSLFGADVNYVLSDKDYYFGLIEMSKESDVDINTKLEKILKEFIDYPVKEAIIDYFKLPQPRASDNAIMAYIIAIKQSKVNEIQKTIEKSGLNLKYIDVPELALRNILFFHPENSKGFLFAHLNHRYGKIILFKNNELYITRNVELFLENFTTINSKALASQVEENEDLDKLALEIQRSMDYCSSLLKMYIANSVIVSSYSLDCKFLSEYLSTNLGVPVNELLLGDFVKFPEGITKEQQDLYIIAIGAALRDYVGGKIATTN